MDFHDIIMSDLRATAEWRARRIILSDVTLLRRRWPKILFATMHKRQADMENLRRLCRHRLERAFSHGRPGYCPQCKEYVTGALDRHMMKNHLELGQLWWCPVEWCAVYIYVYSYKSTYYFNTILNTNITTITMCTVSLT